MLRATIAALYLVYCIAMYSILFLSVLQLTIIFFFNTSSIHEFS